MTGDEIIVGFDGSRSDDFYTMAIVRHRNHDCIITPIFKEDNSSMRTKSDYPSYADFKAWRDSNRVFVLDRDALSGLPTDTRIRITTGAVPQGLIRSREAQGAWQWLDSAFGEPYGNVSKAAFRDDWFPVEVLNPELMGEFKAAEPKPKFKVGDRVYFVNDIREHAPQEFPGTIVDTVDSSYGDYRVQWDGPWSNQNRKAANLAALRPEDDPKLQPIREEFNLTGAYVADRAGLDALPVGTVIERAYHGYAPILKINVAAGRTEWRYLWDEGMSTRPVVFSATYMAQAKFLVKHVPGELPAVAA